MTFLEPPKLSQLSQISVTLKQTHNDVKNFEAKFYLEEQEKEQIFQILLKKTKCSSDIVTIIANYSITNLTSIECLNRYCCHKAFLVPTFYGPYQDIPLIELVANHFSYNCVKDDQLDFIFERPKCEFKIAKQMI